MDEPKTAEKETLLNQEVNRLNSEAEKLNDLVSRLDVVTTSMFGANLDEANKESTTASAGSLSRLEVIRRYITTSCEKMESCLSRF